MAPRRQRSSPAGRDRDQRIGLRVAELRKERGLSMDELGDLCLPKATGSQINKVEKGQLKALTIEWIYRLADALGVPVLELTEPLPPEEQALLRLYRGLSDEGRETVFRVAGMGAEPPLKKRGGGGR